MSRSPSGRSLEPATALLAVGAALLLLLTVLVGAGWDAIQDLDRAVSGAAHDLVGESSATLSLARGLTHLGDPLVVTLATFALAAGLAVARAYRAAIYVLAVRLVVVVATTGIKDAVARARPDEAHPVAIAHGYSFPSGHSSGSAALWCSVAVLIAARTRRSVAVAVAVVVPVVVATTRVLLGVHFLTDVIAGLVLGVEIAVGLAMLRSWRLPSSSRRG